ncbi:MAG: 2OG-Fe dioxygenase family protein [Alphaproteobacteria bacterium]|nr:2OG-Fe dioxygenase family protein [Alphaproteobacteria bacterium]
MSAHSLPDPLVRELSDTGFVRIGASRMQELVGPSSMKEWPLFKASWNSLALDEYMADGGTYRRRSFAVFLVGPNFAWRRAHRPHYQDREHNSLNGGVERWFAPMAGELTNGLLVNALLRAATTIFNAEGARRLWYVEMHQFRIEARPDGPGLPTPEGLHRDGVDWVFMVAVERSGVTGGVSQIHGPDGREISSFTLKEPFEAILLDDRRVLHGVTPIHPLDSAVAGHRDILVVTFKQTTEWNP